MAWDIQGFDLGRAAAGAAQIQGLRDAKEARELRRQQMALEQEKAGQEIALRKQKWEALRLANQGDPSMLQQVDPELYMKMQGEQRAQTAAMGEAQAKSVDLATKRAQETSKYQAEWSRMLEQDPRWAPQIEARKAQMVADKAIDDFDLGGQTVAIEGEGAISVPALKMPTKPEDDPWAKTNSDQLDYARILSSRKLDPRDQANWAGYDGWLRQRDAGKATKIDLGGTGKQTTDLRKEWQGQKTYQDTQSMAAAYQKVATSSDDAAGHMSLIFGIMRMQDPNSTVREGEYATAQNAAGVPERIRNLYNKAADGKPLGSGQRRSFMKEAGKLFGAQKARHDAMAKQYRRLATEAGISPDNVVLPTDLESVGQLPPEEQRKQKYDNELTKIGGVD